MARDIFICHSSEDRSVAHELMAKLEEAGITCWIAPRDVMPGADYAQAIVSGIAGARVLVLMFSQHSNASPHVHREVERAVSQGLDIIPYRVESVTPSPTLEYFIGGAEWVDGTSGSVSDHAVELAGLVHDRLYGAAGGSPRDEARRVLRQLVERYGTGLVDDPRRVQALMRDLAGHHRAEVAALVAAADEGVGASLLRASGGLTPETAERLARRLHVNRALTEDASGWAVSAWLYALGVEGPSEEDLSDAVASASGQVTVAPAAPDVGSTVAAAPSGGVPGAGPGPGETLRRGRVSGLLPAGGRRRTLAAFIGGGALVVASVIGAVALTGGSTPDVLGEQSLPSSTAAVSSLPVPPASELPATTTTTRPAATTTTTAPTTTITTSATATTVTDGEGVAVPNIIGLFHLTASVRLKDAGFDYQKTSVCEDETQSTFVLSQTPAAGTIVPAGSLVSFTYQSSSVCGPLPDLVGLTVEAAQNAWAAAGFTPNNLSFTNYRCHSETFGEGLVWWHTGVVDSLQPLQFAHMAGYVNTCEGDG